MRRSHMLDAYLAGLATAFAALVYGYQFAAGARFITQLCRLGL